MERPENGRQRRGQPAPQWARMRRRRCAQIKAGARGRTLQPRRRGAHCYLREAVQAYRDVGAPRRRAHPDDAEVCDGQLPALAVVALGVLNAVLFCRGRGQVRTVCGRLQRAPARAQCGALALRARAHAGAPASGPTMKSATASPRRQARSPAGASNLTSRSCHTSGASGPRRAPKRAFIAAAPPADRRSEAAPRGRRRPALRRLRRPSTSGAGAPRCTAYYRADCAPVAEVKPQLARPFRASGTRFELCV